MHVFLPASDKTYFKATSPAVKTAGKQYANRRLPLFTVRSEKEAWTEPFISIFEPSTRKEGGTIVAVERVPELCDHENTVLHVQHADGSAQFIFQGNHEGATVKGRQFCFSGFFGVISIGSNGKLHDIYLGEGSHIAFNNVKVLMKNSPGSAWVKLNEEEGDLDVSIDVSGE
jgi:hypothetical protein